MPPKAAKEKVVKGDEAEEMVLQYLKSVNRPYSSTDVSANLKNKVPKPAAQKIMLTLAERGEIVKKEYGKQQVFVYNQSNLPVLSGKQMNTIDTELKKVQGELEEKRKELKDLQSHLSSKMALPKTKDLGKDIENLRVENDLTTQALAPYRTTDNGQPAVSPLTKDDAKRIDDEFVKWRKEWVDRRKVYKEALGALCDGGAIDSVPAFEEDQGISPDDEESKAVEEGDFCKPQVTIRSKIVQRTTTVPTAKRTTSASASTEGPKTKKGKKA
ncbi:hypothetical protein M231_03609 [Tremella mesenterica]|uniref:Homologous-pairing protein 2 winged helix domain-containing protein n=1 Tax=Tremella mesenterica TaxID=5217 RepID=A0A4Q1BMP8_TREME|nr:hypothetical protein M231_03609 [Tremella mesenterica]